MLKQIDKLFVSAVIVCCILGVTPAWAALSCSITTAALCTDTIVLRMSANTNAHAEMPDQVTPGYSNNVICCSGVSGVACSGRYATVLKLSSTTNAHVETASGTSYLNNACMSSSSEIPVIAYQDTNCTGYDTSLASISSTTNATIGNVSNYTKKICGSVLPASITFTISTSTIYFGVVSPVFTRYASSTNSSGSDTNVVAHTFEVVSNALNGYTVTVKGATLISGTSSISAIGAINTTPTIGVEQFGIRLTSSGGGGVVSSPYAASGFAYAATATTSSEVASASVGDNATTTFSVRYVANIAPTTPPAIYTTSIIYVATANF